MADAPEVRIKGIQFHNLNCFVLKHFGSDGAQKICSMLAPDKVKPFLHPVAHNWYQLSQLIAIQGSIIDAFYGGDITKAALLGQFNTEESIGRIYRFMFRFLSPETLLARAPKLWSLHAEPCNLQVEKLGDRCVKAIVTDSIPVSKLICHYNRGSFLGAISACGIPESQIVVQEIECVTDNYPSCVYKVSW